MTEARKHVRRPHWQRPGYMHLAVLLAYALLTVVMTWPLARNAAVAIPGDGFDGWQNYWNLWWLKTALVERITNPFVTDILYYPTGVGLYFHTLNPLNGLLSMPVQMALGLIPAYNFVVLVSWTLSGYGAFLLSLWLMRSGDGHLADEEPQRIRPGMARLAGAFLAGVVYGFAPFHMAHLLGHMQVMSLQWIPFYILFLLRGIASSRAGRPWKRDAIVAGVFLIFSGLSDWYFVLYLFLFTLLTTIYFGVVDLIAKRKQSALRGPQYARSLLSVLAPPAVAGMLFLVVLSPVLIPMVREATRFSFMVRPASDLYILSASLLDYLIPSRMHTLLRGVGGSLPGNQIAPVSERTIAIGYTVMALAAVAIGVRRKRLWFWVIAALFFLAMSLGPQIHIGNFGFEEISVHAGAASETASITPFGLLNSTIPFMSISRSVSRYALMVQLSFAMLAGVGLCAIMARLSRRAAVAFFPVVLAATLFEYWVAPYPLSRPDTPSFYSELASLEGDGAVLNLPMNYDRPGYLLYQTVHHKPLTVAYISREDPRTMTERVPILQHFRHLGPDIIGDDPVESALTVLNDLGVEYVALDRYKMPSGTEREYTESLALEVFGDNGPVYEDDRLTVYRISPVVDAQPYIELAPVNWGPLMNRTPDEDVYARMIDDMPACFKIHHPPERVTVSLNYRSEADSPGRVVDDSGLQVAELPAAEAGNNVEFDLGADAPVSDAIELCIVPPESGAITVERISIVHP